MATASACGKVILLGEHGVVYGRPALAAGLARGAVAEFFPAPSGHGDTQELALEIAPLGVRVTAGDASDPGRALRALCAELGPEPAGTVRATLHVPAGGGLGSSAALGVATARALAVPLGLGTLDMDQTARAALAWERVFHGNPSGVDHTVAARGGAGTYSRTEGYVPVPLSAPVRLLIADTGERAPTRDMVAQVARIHARKPANAEKTFDAIAALVRNGALALSAGDLRGFGQLMDLNQALLAGLMVSTERTEDLCRAAREAGAFGAKLTGGGGGGCVIALAPPEREQSVLSAWASLDAPAFGVEIE